MDRSVSKAKLESLGDGRFRVSGVLDSSTVSSVLEQSAARFANAPQIHVDLAGVTESDSAGLALLIEWLRLARERSLRIEFAHLPAQLNALARISEVEDLLAVADGTQVMAQAATA